MEDQDLYTLTIEDVMERCNISKRTVYDWINKQILNPKKVNGGFLFNEEEITIYEKTITIRTAAQTLGISYQFLKDWVIERDGLADLPSAIKSKQKKYYVTVDWLESNKESILICYYQNSKQRKRDGYGSELTLYNNGFRLFDTYIYSGLKCRILNVDTLELLMPNGSTAVVKEKLEGQSNRCLDHPYSGYQGSTVFQFDIEKNLEEYLEAMNRLVYLLGTKNIRLFRDLDSSVYHAVCRTGLIPFEASLFETLRLTVIEGTVWVDNKSNIVIGDYYVRVNIPIRYDYFLRIESLTGAIEQDSINKWIGQEIEKIILHEKISNNNH